MNYYNFFTTDNKSGWKTRENLLEKNEPEVYNKVKDFATKNNLNELPFKERVWCFINDNKIKPTCLGCGGEVKFHNRLKRGYMKFCNLECANSNKNIMLDLQKTAIQEKYGVDFFPQHKSFIKKQKKTKLERYGDENYVNIEKGKKTKLERYGDENYANIEKGKKTCMERYGVDNFSKSKNYNVYLEKQIQEIYDEHNILEYDRETGVAKLKCERCDDIFNIELPMLRGRVKHKNTLCTICNPKGQSWISSGEQEIIDYIKSLGITNILISDRSILGRMEIDIYLPDYKLAIEYDGLHWHSDIFKKNDYHLNKTTRCQEKGIQLIHIFEDELIYKPDIVKSRIRAKLSLNTNRIYARKCEIKELTNKDIRSFLNDNHIQGHVNSKINVGLFYNDELISLMTFGGLRRALGNVAKVDSYELIRFVSKKDCTVIGGASKLLSYFKKTYKPKYILSYADKRWSNGDLYLNLGFTHIADSKPNYWYVNNDKREYRFKYRKSVLVADGFDPNLSEREIMIERGFKRIYDCGNMKFEMLL